MKTVLCFGDSLTWGYIPGGEGRHVPENRWPEALEMALEGQVRVISEGLNGRTTMFDDYSVDADRNGVRILPTVLQSHAPLDLVILMLGTNDLKPFLAGSAMAAERGMSRLVQIVRRQEAWGAGMPKPEILIMSPPLIGETDDEYAAGMVELLRLESLKLADLYEALAEQTGCAFFDTAKVAKASRVDGVHLDAANSRAIGEAIAPLVKGLLAGA